MMIRYSEVGAKRVEMERESDPRHYIEEPVERTLQDEVEALREQEADIDRGRSVGKASSQRLRRSERDR